ncbi:hypothetical protein DICPUDRAFT_152445 [Dictyostelium purpureum]|uniref:Uncharacterized protein n=1 Tax=Dictyostelium purpureum TaxID=5786 RepID=F0ZLD5_DICPU|nr:uncharacterized protein DICPUDRAFT_152445 [Dictyostelium purpureum]EGC35250.1 hypothetical protein DICPUDRAFT_152445 [Dictyostelium purpureum]|eukprot:XP_003288237.1 hypothetical protein DICPUDRAFT_152445 [Dictyostelium purpureum]
MNFDTQYNNNSNIKKDYADIAFDTDEGYDYDPNKIIYDQDPGFTEKMMELKREDVNDQITKYRIFN